MDWNTTFVEWLERFSVVYGILTLRYIIIAGLAFLIVWKILSRRLEHKYIQPDRRPTGKNILHEIKYSFMTFFVFGLVGVFMFEATRNGWTRIYRDVGDFGWPYFFVSLLGTILLHDAYFYWTHRLMHWKKIFKHVHLVHHRSTNPTPWAAFSFHPLEAIIEAGIVPLVAFLYPIHAGALLLFLFYMTSLNVLGHLGYELFPSGFTRNRSTLWHNTSTHHNMHHKYFNCNYGLYFNWWDRFMKTNHPEYHEQFESKAAATSSNNAHAKDRKEISSPDIATL
ncbi:MAG: sterol desaturase [Spirochaetaceae bacterium]|jgi:lathosterol oxidase|nr:sterol desaturase [Spirochaetaceae bacterium]|tara:strand:- start:60947 stop:61789 length:843 start_codon:yes stop_codon:yes gene_type:complete